MNPSTWDRQRRSFENTADAYDRYRPSYPGATFDDVRRYADLAPEDDRILEIGCGTGRATRFIADWPNRILALEPAAAMADVARSNLAGYPNVEVLTTSFEDWAVEPFAFGLVLCAQAFHWLDPDTRDERIASALYAHGAAAIVSNVQVTPQDSLAFWVRVQDVYLAESPDIAHKGEFRKPDQLPPHVFEDTERFDDLQRSTHPWRWTLSTDDYIGLLQTHSPHAALEPEVRRRLSTGIAELIDGEFGGEVTEHYVCVADLARRR